TWDGSLWREHPGGFRDGTCPLVSPDETPEAPTDKIEKTFTSWELKDINGDGYVDFVFNSSPVVHVADHRVADPSPPRFGESTTKRSPITQTLQLERGAGNQVMAMVNIAGAH